MFRRHNMPKSFCPNHVLVGLKKLKCVGKKTLQIGVHSKLCSVQEERILYFCSWLIQLAHHIIIIRSWINWCLGRPAKEGIFTFVSSQRIFLRVFFYLKHIIIIFFILKNLFLISIYQNNLTTYIQEKNSKLLKTLFLTGKKNYYKTGRNWWLSNMPTTEHRYKVTWDFNPRLLILFRFVRNGRNIPYHFKK